VHQLPPALAPLAALRQFLCYVLVPSKTKPGKMDKFPVSPHSGAVVSAHEPANWVDAQTACDCATAWGPSYGVAFSLQRGNNVFFVDLDSHWIPDTITETGEFIPAHWSPLALQIAAMFPGAYMERSQSGKGMHIIGVGTAPEHSCTDHPRGLEFYTEGRFIALTGHEACGNVATDHTAALHTLTAALFPPGGNKHEGRYILTSEPVPEWRGPTDDDDLLRRALKSSSAAAVFGNRASFADLWECNTAALTVAYPDKDKPYNFSEADAALVSHLAFWTGKHGERIKALMQRDDCKLHRDKWDRAGDDYLTRTICEILAKGGDVLQDNPPEPSALPNAAPMAPEQRLVTGSTFLGVAAQRDLFKGCVYVRGLHRVLVPGGHLLKPDPFNVEFGGYAFAMDDTNSATTKKAWDAFTQSQVLRAPMADTVSFKPDQPSATITDDAGRKRVNIWWPAEVRRLVGDVSPFLDHLRRVLPDERDQALLLSYMAACVQYKGKKFGWCPVLQGAEGNGKTLFSLCVAMAVGQHYTHWPHAQDLASPFNAWLANKVFIAVEELYSQEHQQEIIEKFKTIITGAMGIQIQAKGVDQYSTEICANAMATTNYKTSVRKTPDNARRFGMFFTAQQSKDDIERSGMGGDYFPRLYGWLKADGFAIVSELLHTYPIPDEYNPATTLHRAPHTSTTDTAITESRGGIEQQIMEFVAQGRTGFAGNWISSGYLDSLLDALNMGAKIPHSKRREMMAGLGYILHPGLHDGRVNNPVDPDGRKVQLFVVKGAQEAHIVGAAEIAKAYTAAQKTSIGVK